MRMEKCHVEGNSSVRRNGRVSFVKQRSLNYRIKVEMSEDVVDVADFTPFV
jgi:hypothetical protein